MAKKKSRTNEIYMLRNIYNGKYFGCISGIPDKLKKNSSKRSYKGKVYSCSKKHAKIFPSYQILQEYMRISLKDLDAESKDLIRKNLMDNYEVITYTHEASQGFLFHIDVLL